MLKSMPGARRSTIALGIVLIVLLALTAGLLLRRALSQKNDPVIKLGYCGPDPAELCILSFGRDQQDNMIVSLFVPEKDFPDFYVKVKRAAGENKYDCHRNKTLPVNVYCLGPGIGLQERMEISLFAVEDDRLLAEGKMSLQAVLLSPVQALDAPTPFNRDDAFDITPPSLFNVTPTPAFDLGGTILDASTPTDIPVPLFATDTPTPTATSYPGPSYP